MNEPQRPMPQYQCHKKVWALKIAGISSYEANCMSHLAFEDTDFAPQPVATAWLERYKVRIGGYYVVYDDGYESYSPADAFEAGYTPIDEVIS